MVHRAGCFRPAEGGGCGPGEPGQGGHGGGVGICTQRQGVQPMTSQPGNVLEQLSAAGVSIWLDDISRDRLTTGNLAKLMTERHVVGVTSNPTIFAHALGGGSAYDQQAADLALRGV